MKKYKLIKTLIVTSPVLVTPLIANSCNQNLTLNTHPNNWHSKSPNLPTQIKDVTVPFSYANLRDLVAPTHKLYISGVPTPWIPAPHYYHPSNTDINVRLSTDESDDNIVKSIGDALDTKYSNYTKKYFNNSAFFENEFSIYTKWNKEVKFVNSDNGKFIYFKNISAQLNDNNKNLFWAYDMTIVNTLNNSSFSFSINLCYFPDNTAYAHPTNVPKQQATTIDYCSHIDQFWFVAPSAQTISLNGLFPKLANASDYKVPAYSIYYDRFFLSDFNYEYGFHYSAKDKSGDAYGSFGNINNKYNTKYNIYGTGWHLDNLQISPKSEMGDGLLNGRTPNGDNFPNWNGAGKNDAEEQWYQKSNHNYRFAEQPFMNLALSPDGSQMYVIGGLDCWSNCNNYPDNTYMRMSIAYTGYNFSASYNTDTHSDLNVNHPFANTAYSWDNYNAGETILKRLKHTTFTYNIKRENSKDITNEAVRKEVSLYLNEANNNILTNLQMSKLNYTLTSGSNILHLNDNPATLTIDYCGDTYSIKINIVCV